MKMTLIAPTWRRLHFLKKCGAILFLSWSSWACSGSRAFERSLDEMWQWDGGVEATRIVSAVQSAKVPENIPAAVGITGRGLVGRTLPAGKLWTYEGPVDVMPTLVADVAIFSGEGRVTMLDLRTGATRFSIDVKGRRLEGAGFDGKFAILLLVDSHDAREDQILVVGPKGSKGLSVKATARLGTPVAVGGIGLIPYAGQYLGGLDLSTGKHIGRLLLRDGLHSALVDEGNVLLLGAGATLLSGEITSSPESHSLKLKAREFPGEPTWPIDGSKPRPARSKPVGLYAHPSKKNGRLSFSTGGYVATYFEVVVGLDQGTNKVRWATQFPRAVTGGAVSSSGLTLCLENGSLWRVNMQTGTRSPYGSLETRLRGCVVSASTETAPTGSRPPLLTQIVETISKTGPDMVSMQRLLLAELADSEGIGTTLALLDVAQDPLVSVDLAKKAAELLEDRNEGGSAMIDALRKGAPRLIAENEGEVAAGALAKEEPQQGEKAEPEVKDQGDTWEEGEASEASEASEEKASDRGLAPGARRRARRPPPIGSLAKALTRLKTPGAAAALAPYLADPSLSPKDARAVMIALKRMGDSSQIPEVLVFFGNYKNTGGEKALLDALVSAAQFLDKHLDKEGKIELRSSVNQGLTQPDLQKRLRRKLHMEEKPEAGELAQPDRRTPSPSPRPVQ